MWPVRELRVELPESFCLFENAHFAYLCCSRCGWQAIFSAAGATVGEILQAVTAHVAECPAR